jgi:hypothetical protein
MSLSRNQNALYWREWSAAKRALMPGRETWTKDEETNRRHELHIQALGEEKSHVDFSNDDFDKVLAAFRAVSRPGDLNAQLHALNGQRKRLMFGIRRLAKSMGADEFYVAGIVRTMNAEGKLGSDDLEQLHPRELTKVMVALKKHESRGGLHVQTSCGPASPHSDSDPF